MIKKWHHGHSLGAGVLVGVGIVSYRVWILIAAAFLAGWISRVVYGWAKSGVDHWLWQRKRSGASKQVKRVSTGTQRVSLQTDEIPWD